MHETIYNNSPHSLHHSNNLTNKEKMLNDTKQGKTHKPRILTPYRIQDRVSAGKNLCIHLVCKFEIVRSRF
jgi:hypothetical protein